MSPSPLRSKRPKVAVPMNELENHLLAQIGFLQRSIRDFDDGHLDEFRRMAVAIRVLAHDTAKSHSLLQQIGLKNQIKAYNSLLNRNNLLTEFTVGGMCLSDKGTSYTPILKTFAKFSRTIPFSEWWTEIIIIDQARTELSRKDIVTAVANQDGGAHVDPQLDATYHALARLNSLGWVFSTNRIESQAEHAEKVAVRHIAFELLDHLETTFLIPKAKQGCWCGSGLLARYCHLKDAMKLRGKSGEPKDQPIGMSAKSKSFQGAMVHGATVIKAS